MIACIPTCMYPGKDSLSSKLLPSLAYRVVHELIHTLGLWHEHNRPDRDDHISINWDNIEESWRKEFEKNDPDKVDMLGPYDICSIMHYADHGFTKNGKLT